jgi:hypothetical protein
MGRLPLNLCQFGFLYLQLLLKFNCLSALIQEIGFCALHSVLKCTQLVGDILGSLARSNHLEAMHGPWSGHQATETAVMNIDRQEYNCHSHPDYPHTWLSR